MVVVLCSQLLSGCDKNNHSAPESKSPKFTQAPRIIATDFPMPLAAAIALQADQPVTTSYRISNGQTSWQAHSRNRAIKGELHTKHRDILLKFKPHTSHRIHVRITNAAGQSAEYSKPLLFQTPPLPPEFPQIKVDFAGDPNLHNEVALITHNPAQTDPWSTSGKITGWLIGIDSAGSVVWYMPTDNHWHRIEQHKSGSLYLYSQAGNTLEIDMLGNKKSAWLSPKQTNPEYQAATAYFSHHGLVPKVRSVAIVDRPVKSVNGHRLALTKPVTLTHKTATTSIAEIDSQGKVLQQTNLAKLGAQHITGLAYQTRADNLIVSLGEQRALIALDRISGQLEWVLNTTASQQWPKQLQPYADSEGEISLYNPHQPHISAEGHIVLFDQNQDKAGRIVVYAIETDKNKFKQLAQYPLAQVQLPVRMHLTKTTDTDLNTGANTEQNLLLSYRQGSSTVIKRLSLTAILQTEPIPPLQVALQLTQGSVDDNLLVDYLIPPEFSLSANTYQASANRDSNDRLQPPENKSEAIKETVVSEGDWIIAINTLEGLSEQLLKIDMQRGPIAVGYLDDYPVLVTIKGSKLSFTARTKGTEGTAKWRYQGTIDASGVNAEGLLTISNRQGEILAKDIHWQAYRTDLF